MPKILPFIRPEAVFDDATTQIMGEAFDAACDQLQDCNLPGLAREIIADRIIGAAKRGERNPKRLCDIGVAAIRPPRRTDVTHSGTGNQSEILR
jgi:hypothetical protein